MDSNCVSNGKINIKCKNQDTALRLYFFLQGLCDNELIEDINDNELKGEELIIR